MFSQAFGFGSATKGNQKYNLDALSQLDLSFKEAVFGCKKTIKNTYKKPCPDCEGSGSKDGKTHTCPQCEGRGQVFIKQGFMAFGQTCPQCKGEGKIIKNPCGKCKGEGFVSQEESFEVEVPEGIDSEMRIRIAKKGNEDKNKQRGDLYVIVYVQDDKHFIRHGDDVYIEVPVFFTQILLGAQIGIPSLDGKTLDLNLPPNSKDKAQFIFANKGIKDVNSNHKGRLIAQITIVYPESFNAELKELNQKLHTSFGIQGEPYKNIFQEAFEKIKHWFQDSK